MCKACSVWAAILLGLLVAAASVRAEQITFRFEGTVIDQAITRPPWNVPIGAPAFMEFTFDPTTPDTYIVADTGAYTGAIGLFTVGAGATRGAGYGGDIFIYTFILPFDYYLVSPMLLVNNFYVSVELRNDPSVLTSDALPTTINLDDWAGKDGYITDANDGSRAHVVWTSFRIVSETTTLHACCNTSTGFCGLVTAADCSGLGGTAQSTESCSPNPCVVTLPSGACCQGTGCTIVPSFSCLGGAWQGAGSVCEPAPGVNACCRADFNNSGVLSVQDIFDFLAAYFAGCP